MRPGESVRFPRMRRQHAAAALCGIIVDDNFEIETLSEQGTPGHREPETPSVLHEQEVDKSDGHSHGLSWLLVVYVLSGFMAVFLLRGNRKALLRYMRARRRVAIPADPAEPQRRSEYLGRSYGSSLGSLVVRRYDPKEFTEQFGCDTMCSICLVPWEAGEVLKVTTCGHAFHPACIDQWLLNAPTCAMCRCRLVCDDDLIQPGMRRSRLLDRRRRARRARNLYMAAIWLLFFSFFLFLLVWHLCGIYES